MSRISQCSFAAQRAAFPKNRYSSFLFEVWSTNSSPKSRGLQWQTMRHKRTAFFACGCKMLWSVWKSLITSMPKCACLWQASGKAFGNACWFAILLALVQFLCSSILNTVEFLQPPAFAHMYVKCFSHLYKFKRRPKEPPWNPSKERKAISEAFFSMKDKWPSDIFSWARKDR